MEKVLLILLILLLIGALPQTGLAQTYTPAGIVSILLIILLVLLIFGRL
jgi:uncharacterized membrane protein YtjA (UPF0391 family)